MRSVCNCACMRVAGFYKVQGSYKNFARFKDRLMVRGPSISARFLDTTSRSAKDFSFL